MAWAGDGAGGHLTVLARVPAAILESGSSEEEEDEDEEAAPGQHLPLDPVPGDAEARLAQLEQVSQALLAELAALDAEVELEQRCQQRAQVGTGTGTGPQKCPFMGTKDLSQLPEHHRDLQEQLQLLRTQLQLEREEQQRLRAALGASQRALRSFKRVSQIVTQDYCQALEQLELEQDLRCHAEAFAHQMLVQQREAKRQSSILLRSAGPDSQILEAFQELGKLSRELEETRREGQQREKELEEQLEKEREELDRARAALEEAREEKRELKERLEGLEKEVGSLREQLASPQSRPEVPPPPPLPPPAATAVPTDPLAALRQRKAPKSRERSDPGTEDIRARAVQEMLERIRSGIVLRPARERPHLRQDSMASKRRSAVLELQGILGATLRPSRRRSGKSQDPQLGSILERRRRALDDQKKKSGNILEN
ncbi:shootin-1-like [Cinclus cinclus]|uniref:shootin-1-like n=1 Tax=Cinclus cinclus TaxID=127875 RepID=UPI002E13D492